MTTATIMRRKIYFVLVGALMFVTRETVCIAIHSDERRGVDSMESGELLEHDDFSLEQVHVGSVFGSQSAGQFVPTQTTNNGPTGQVTGLKNLNIRNPVLIHSDEHDTFSDEVSLAGILANIRNVPSQVTTAGGQEPIRGKRIFKQSDERYIVSARPGKQVVIRPGATPGNPIQTTSIHKAIYRHSDEDGDYSDEVRSIFSPPSTRLVPTNNVNQSTNKPSAVYRLHSDEHEVYFSDDVIRSQIGALPSSVNSYVQTPLTVNGPLISTHSDEIYDTSYEVITTFVNQQNGQNLTAPTRGVLISRHSDERDDSMEIVRGQIRPAGVLPVQTAVTGAVPFIRKHSDEVDDISLEIHGAIRSGPSPISVATIQNQGVHLIQRHSNEHDDTSLEIQLIRNQSAPGQFHLLKHSDGHLLEVTGTNLNLQNGEIVQTRPVQTVIPGQHLIGNSDEIGDVSLEIHHVMSGVQPINTVGRIVPAVATDIEHLLTHSDEQHDISLEDVIRRDPSQAIPVEQGVLDLDSYEHKDLSLEVDINLLSDIQRLFTNARTDVVGILPEIQTPVTVIKASTAEVNQNGGNLVVQQRMSRLLKQNISQQLQDILANPVFQQKIQEIDSRLKSAPDSRSKRLIEKYAEALALSSSPSFNAASATINPSLYLSFLITWILVWLL